MYTIDSNEDTLSYFWRGVILVIISLFIIWTVHYFGSEQTLVRENIKKLKKIHSAQQNIRDLVADPSSAQFRSMYVNGYAICGEVNSKNESGNYLGYEPFLVLFTGVFIGRDKGGELIHQHCKNLYAIKGEGLSDIEAALKRAF